MLTTNRALQNTEFVWLKSICWVILQVIGTDIPFDFTVGFYDTLCRVGIMLFA